MEVPFTLETTEAIATEIAWQKEWLRRRNVLVDRLVPGSMKDELAKPYRASSTVGQNQTQLLQDLLEGLAELSDLLPPTLPTPPVLPSLSYSATIDYLLRLVVHPFTTSPDHPALCKAKATATKDTKLFQVYMRCQRNTLQQLLADMKRFVSVYESYYPTLCIKIDYLEQLGGEQLGGNQIVYVRYFGQTIATDALGRLEQDKNSRSNMTLFKSYCKRFEAEGEFEAYDFPGLQSQVDGRIDARASWLSCPSFWNAEHLVVLAGCLGSMNSAAGGVPQVQHAIPKTLRVRYSHTSFPTVGRPLPDSDIQALVAKVTRHYLHMRDYYMRMRSDGVERGILGVPAILTQARQVVHGMRTVGNRAAILLVGKEITEQDAKTGSTFWSADSGPGPKLIQQLVKLMRTGGKASDDDGAKDQQFTMPFADLWCVTTAQTDYDLAVVCLARLLHIINPYVIGAMSDITSSAIEHIQVCEQPQLCIFEADSQTDVNFVKPVKLIKGELSEGFLSMNLPPADEFEAATRFAAALKIARIKAASVDSRRIEGSISEEYKTNKAPSSDETATWLLRLGGVKITGPSLVVSMLDPGYFAYLPAAQRLLFPVYILQSELLHLTETVVGALAPLNSMDDILEAVIAHAEYSQLWDTLQDAKQRAYDLISAIISLRNRRLGWDEEEEQLRQMGRSVGAQKRRETVMDKQIRLEGLPYSEEREIQLQALSKKENYQLEHTLEAKEILRGSSEWWSTLLKAPAGTFVALSINAAAAVRTKSRAPEVMYAQLADARQAKARAQRLPVSGYSEKHQLNSQEALDWVTDSTRKFKVAKTDSCLLACLCKACGKSAFLFGLSNLHFCTATTSTKGISLGSAESTVEIRKMLFPPFFASNMRLVAQPEKYLTLEGSPGETAAIVRRDIGTEDQQSRYIQLQLGIYNSIRGLMRQKQVWRPADISTLELEDIIDKRYSSYMRK